MITNLQYRVFQPKDCSHFQAFKNMNFWPGNRNVNLGCQMPIKPCKLGQLSKLALSFHSRWHFHIYSFSNLNSPIQDFQKLHGAPVIPWFDGSKMLINTKSKFQLSETQCGNFSNFMSLRFYVKPISGILEVQKLPF